MLAKCDNCGKVFPCADGALKVIPDLALRLDPGSEVPAAVCPGCGALAYVYPEKPARARTSLYLAQSVDSGVVVGNAVFIGPTAVQEAAAWCVKYLQDNDVPVEGYDPTTGSFDYESVDYDALVIQLDLPAGVVLVDRRK